MSPVRPCPTPWRLNATFVGYELQNTTEAQERTPALANGNRTVSILVEQGRLDLLGRMGRGCMV